ncbi:MAG: hypothetical protein ACYS1A_09085 [Planctomycetota bacterium]|jgi:hypothetical protein
METKEKRNDEKGFAGKWPNMSCCGTQGGPEMMPDCCKNTGQADDPHSMMSKCMKGCRWFPLVPVILGIALLLLGYYLDAQITRILWMIAAGFIVLMGTFGILMMSKMKKICCG